MKVQRSTGDNGMMSIQQGGNAAWPLTDGNAAFLFCNGKGKRKWQTTRNL